MSASVRWARVSISKALNFIIPGIFGVKVMPFLSDLKKKIQTAVKFFFIISNLLFKKKDNIKCLKIFVILHGFFSNNAENKFAFIEYKGRIIIKPSFIASSFITMPSVNCLYGVYPSPPIPIGPCRQLLPGLIIMKGSERLKNTI